MKKTIMIFFALCVMLTMVFASPIHTLAAEGSTVLVMKGRESAATREIEIEVKVEENSGVCGMLLSLEYDTSVFTLTGLEYGEAFSSLSPIHTNVETEEGYGVYPFKITYLGDENDTSTGRMMTLRFRVKENVPNGKYTITLKHERDGGVTYLKNNEILTKNLLIDGARITLSENKVTKIDTIKGSNGENGLFSDSVAIWLPVTVGGLVLVSGGFLLTSHLVKRKKSKKWKKI